MSQRSIILQNPTISTQNIRAIRKILIKWGEDNYNDFPWRKTRIKWHGLIAEILLQRTRAKNVLPVYIEFTKKYRTCEKFFRASESDISELIYPLGLKWRAPLLKRLASSLFFIKGRLPKTEKELTKLPGVGKYAANAWLCFHGGIRTVIIDANVVRFVCRILNIKFDGETRRKKWLFDLANSLTPKNNWRIYNYALLDFTINTCSKRPLCKVCPVFKLCEYENKEIEK